MKIQCCVAVLMATIGVAHADPVTWYLNNVTFSDQSRAVGSFTYDSNTNTFTNINIQSTPGAGVTSAQAAGAGGTYRLPIAGTALDFRSDTELSATTRRVRLLTNKALLTNNGGSVPVTSGSQEGFCGDLVTCATAASGGRSITGGTLEAISSTGPKTWYVNATFDDGGQIIGSFLFDANTGVFSNINVHTSGSTLNTAFTRAQYTNIQVTPAPSGTSFRFLNAQIAAVGTRALTFSAAPSPLTNAAAANTKLFANPPGGLRIGATESTCANAQCTATSNVVRTVTSGTLTNVAPANFTRILPHIVNGGAGSPFRTEVVITNLTDAPASYGLSFADDGGSNYAVPGFAPADLSSVVPARGQKVVRSAGLGSAPLTQGSGKMVGGDSLAATTVFTWINGNAGGDQQGSVIAESQGTTSITVPIDGAAGSLSGVALANPGISPVTVLVVGYDTTGRIIMNDSSLVLPAGGHISFVFDQNRYPQLVNQRGHVRLFAIEGGSPPYLGVNALVLKFLQNFSFTTLGATSQ